MKNNLLSNKYTLCVLDIVIFKYERRIQMKLINTIVDANFNLIGFMVRGKAREFGEMGTEQTERPLSIRGLMNNKFNNNQAYFGDGKITEKGKFHINQLEMLMNTGDTFNKIDNTITLTSRFVHENENIGFGVNLGGIHDDNIKYNDVIKLAELFKPTNFITKINDHGKIYIAGKPGSPLSSLPTHVIGEAGTNKKTKSGAKKATPVSGKVINVLDIFDVFDFVNANNGFIINFAGTEYKATGESYEKANEKFTSLGIGEVGSPRLTFNETKFNATCRFKNPGVIYLENKTEGPVFAAASSPVYTFIYRSKNIFYNGEHHLNKIGIIIPESAVNELYDRFSSSMAIMKVNDSNVIQIVNRLINWKNSAIFEVDVSKLALISPNKYDKYILDDMEIYRNTLKLATAKISMIYVRGALKELAGYGYVSPPKNRPIVSQFALKTEKELKELIMAGINIYDGSFTEPGETVFNKNSTKDANPEIRYIIEGLDPKNFSYDKLTNTDKCPDNVAKLIATVQGVTNFDERAKLLNSIMVELEKSQDEALKSLWLHKTSMWLKNDKLGVHKSDADHWTINTKKRTKATCYDNTIPNVKGLQILLSNIDLIK